MALIKELEKTEIWAKVEPFINEMGASVLFWRESKSRHTLKIELTLFCPSGVDMDLIERVHRLLLPRLEALWGSDDVLLDISSPGVGRTLKSLWELSFFVGRDMVFYLENQAQAIEGILEAVENETISIKTKKETLSLPKKDIKTAKLKG